MSDPAQALRYAAFVNLKLGLLAMVVGVVLAACGGGGDSDSSGSPEAGESPAGASPAAEPGEGSLILSNLNEIVERDIESGSTKVIISAPETNSFFLDPAPSRDGAQVAYINQPPPTIIDGRFDGGSDLWVVNRDGTGARPLFEHAQPNQLIRFPRWESATSVMAIVQEISTEDGITRVVYTLQRIDVTTGARERVLDNVLAFDVSPDGERLVYAKLLPQTGEVLAGASTTGEGDYQLVGLDQLLAPFGYPRFSPDGATVAFASADQTGAFAPSVELVSLQRGDAGSFDIEAAASMVDGLPQDIWTVEAEGGTAVRVADLKEDLPALAWDGSGERIYAIGVEGLYEINLETGAVLVMGEGAFHTQISWAPDVGE